MRFFYAMMAMASLAHIAPLAAEEVGHRELGAHVHGQGSLDIAIEGNKLNMEFEAPGADIVGFEHEASTAEQKALVEKAKATLGEVLTLFKLPSNAGCKIEKANVEIRKEEHHHDEDEHAAGEAKAESGAKKEDHDEDGHDEHAHDEHGGHSEFHAQYALTCAVPANLTALETTYFKAFAGAQALNVNVVAAKGQSQMQLTREKTTLALGGLM